jgi:hypothetical protein
MPDIQPSIPNSLSTNTLQVMQLVARMKEAADRQGIEFVGGFISPEGEKFIMSNMSDEQTQAMLPEDLK